MVRAGEAEVLMKGLVGTEVFLKAVMDRQVRAPAAGRRHELRLRRRASLLPQAALRHGHGRAPVPRLRPEGGHAPLRAAHGPAVRHRRAEGGARLRRGEVHRALPQSTPSTRPFAPWPAAARSGSASSTARSMSSWPATRASLEIKGVATPVAGDADVLLFPSLEACNAFYKGLMLFAGGELGGLIQGTSRPVVVMSRSESARSKLYCLALACLMADPAPGRGSGSRRGSGQIHPPADQLVSASGDQAPTRPAHDSGTVHTQRGNGGRVGDVGMSVR